MIPDKKNGLEFKEVRRIFAERFIEISDIMFEVPSSEFHGLQEHAEMLIAEWIETGNFPEVSGIWIIYKDKFDKWLETL
jgi:hypothetical protein